MEKFTLFYSILVNGEQIYEKDFLKIIPYLRGFIKIKIFNKFASKICSRMCYTWNYIQFDRANFSIFCKNVSQFQSITRDIIYDLEKSNNVYEIDNKKYTIILKDIIFDNDETLDIKCPDE